MAKSNRKLKMDMTGVETYTRCPEGEWLAKLKKIEMGEIQGSGDDCLKAQFEVIKGSAKGCIVYETFSLAEKALWKLKSCLEALGMKAEGKFSLDLDKMEGRNCIIDVIHDEYNGTKRAKISAYVKPGEEDDDDEDEDEDFDEDEEEEDEPPKKSSKKPAKKSKKQPEPEDDDDEDDDEDEDEEEPPKKSKKSSSKRAAKSSSKKSKPEPEDEDEDDDDDWEDDD